MWTTFYECGSPFVPSLPLGVWSNHDRPAGRKHQLCSKNVDVIPLSFCTAYSSASCSSKTAESLQMVIWLAEGMWKHQSFFKWKTFAGSNLQLSEDQRHGHGSLSRPGNCGNRLEWVKRSGKDHVPLKITACKGLDRLHKTAGDGKENQMWLSARFVLHQLFGVMAVWRGENWQALTLTWALPMTLISNRST